MNNSEFKGPSEDRNVKTTEPAQQGPNDAVKDRQPQEPPDPFDPTRLRIDPTQVVAVAEKVLVKVPVRKPNGQEYFRTLPGVGRQVTCAVIMLTDEGETYLVDPSIRHLIAQETRLVTFASA